MKVMGEQTTMDSSSATLSNSKVLPVLTSKTAKSSTTTLTTTVSTIKNKGMTGGMTPQPTQQNSAQPLSPTLTITPPESLGSSRLQDEKSSSFTAGTLHKKDSGTSMASSVESLPSTNINGNSSSSGSGSNGTVTRPPSSMTTTTTKAEPSATATLTPRRAQHSNPHPPPSLSFHASAILDSSLLSSPSEKVLSRPLSTSKLTSTPLTAPHILPNQRYAGFNLAALGQLSPPASAGASLTMSRADTLAFLSANGPSHNSYFSLSATSLSGTTGDDSSSLHGSETGEGERERTPRPMCGSDAISLLDLEDSHSDLVMVDSNGNSSGSGVTGAAMVGESMASALAVVSHHHQPSQKTLETLAGVSGSGGGGGLGGSLAAGLTMTASASQAFLAGVAGSTGSLLGIDHSGFLGDGAGGSSSRGAGSGSATGTISAGSNAQPRSSLPSLTSQARKDVLQRAAMIAAIQQNGGAKIMAAQQRMGRRQDRPSRNIRFSEFHRICEIEYGFEEGKPLLANGRTLIHSTCVQRIGTDDSTEEMQLYIFSDVLVSGTKFGTLCPKPELKIIDKEDPCAMEELKPEGQEGDDEKYNDDDTDSTVSTIDQGSPLLGATKPEIEDSKAATSPVNSVLVENPYAGTLRNQKICRLIQVQADAIEDDERPLLKISGPHFACRLLFGSTKARDGFLSLLNSTILAHKHHLLFQSKYLADLKKFKRHSAFSFDTSFLKTWGLHNGLNLGSMVKLNGSGNIMGHSYYGGVGSPGSGPSQSQPIMGDGSGALTSSPLASPDGAFDPYQYQQHLNRPQSMAGSLFSFAMNGGSFPSFISSSDHSKDASTASSAYATLKGTNAAKALQYHHQQQQQILQNRLSLHAAASAAAATTAATTPNPYQSQRSSTVIDRSSTGSTLSSFDPMWFLKGSSNNESTATTKPARRSISVADIVHLHTDLDGNEGDRKVEEVSIETLLAMKTTAASNAAAAGSANNTMDLTATVTPSNFNNNNRLSSSSFVSFMPSSSSQNSIATLKNHAGWVRDEDATVCMVCTITKFGVLVRKHHCRLCGRVICWKCCQMKDAVLFGEQGLLAAAAATGGGGSGAVGTITNIGGATGELGVVSSGGKAIRVCMDCIDQHQETAAEIQYHLQRNPRRASAPTSPMSPSTPSLPLHGVFGKLMSASTAGGTSHLAPAVVTSGSALSSPQFYPRIRSGLAPHPHHHRASLYRIDVERVGEEEEEEDEEDKEKAEAKKTAPTTTPPSTPTIAATASITTTSTTAANIDTLTEQNDSDESLEEPHEFNEEELVKEEIMSLESEVESLFIHQSSVAAAVVAAANVTAPPPSIPFGMAPRGTSGGSGLSGGSKTRVLRGIPKELLTQRMYQSAMKGSVGANANGQAGNDGEKEEEEKTMEELLAEQDDELMNLVR